MQNEFSSADRDSRQDSELNGSARADAGEIDLDGRDTSQATGDRQDRDLPPGEDDAGGRSQSRVNEWAEKNREVRKRMGRMERQFNQRLADREAEWQRERAELRADLDALRRDRQQGGEPNQAAHDAEINALQDQLEKAHEKGESKEVARLTRVISQKDAEFIARKQRWLMGQEQQEEQDRRGGRQQQRQTQQRQDQDDQPRGPRKPTTGQRWIEEQDWWYDDDKRAERLVALDIDKVLREEEDSDPNSPAHYRELTKRLRAKFPKLDARPLPGGRRAPEDEGDDYDDEDMRGQRRNARDNDPDDPFAGDDDLSSPSRRRERQEQRRPAVPPFNDRGNARLNQNSNNNRRKGKESITPAEQREMLRFKMDPDNDADVQDWLNSRSELQRAETGRRQ